MLTNWLELKRKLKKAKKTQTKKTSWVSYPVCHMANKRYSWDFKPHTDFKPMLHTTLPLCAAIFVVLPLFVHSSIHLCYKRSLSTFSVRGTVLSTRKHEKRSNKKFTNRLKKQETMIRTFRKILSFQSATLVMFMILLKRLPGFPPLPTGWSPNSLAHCLIPLWSGSYLISFQPHSFNTC